MSDCGCNSRHLEGTRADGDTGAWDGPAAMSNCASSDTPASCYAAICAGRRSGDAALQSSWALPHHSRPGAQPNVAGVRNALSRLPQTQGLTNKAAAQAHLEAHAKALGIGDGDENAKRPPKENLVRGVFPLELRESSPAGMPTLEGHFAVFNQWTEIDSLWEGNFLESIAPGAFRKTFSENRQNMRVLFQHGRDPMVGDKPLGPIASLEEDEQGARYEVPLLDTSYNRDLLPALREGLYGASFRFRVTKEEMDKSPKESDYNPKGIPQRVIREAEVMEFGPVTFPAYAGATAGVRSLTDEWVLSRILGEPERVERLLHGIAPQFYSINSASGLTPMTLTESATNSSITTTFLAPALGQGAGASHSPGTSRTEVRKPITEQEFLRRIHVPEEDPWTFKT
jgi:HK97 family phage prohead protease